MAQSKEAVNHALRDLLSTLPKISGEVYESILGNQDMTCEPEEQAFEDCAADVSSDKIWTACNTLNSWINCTDNDQIMNENIWEEIGQNLDCSNPCHSLLALVHLIMSNRCNSNDVDANSRAAAAASLYFVLQRCPGARSRGMTHTITFQYSLKVLTQLTSDPDMNLGVNTAEICSEHILFNDIDNRQYSRRAQSNKNDIPCTFEGCAERLLRELSSSLKYLPLVIGDQRENLSSLVEVLVGALACGKLPTVSSCASDALFDVAFLSLDQAEAAVFKGIIPLILGEENSTGSSTASSSKILRHAGMSVVSKLLGALRDELASTHTLAASFLVLVEHLCHKAPEKAEMRGAVVEAVDTILRQLPTQQRGHFTGFISRFSRSSKVNHRIFAVDLVAELLKGAWIWSLPPVDSSQRSHVVAAKLLNVILARASDKAPTVRARSLGAISALASATSAKEEDFVAASLVDAFLHLGSETHDGEKTINVGELLKRRLADDRAMVRRSATQAVVSFILLNLSTRDFMTSTETNDENAAMCWRDEIDTLVLLCSDVSVATRKAAAVGLASLRSSLPRSASLRKAFIGAVVPMAHDAEQSVQTRCGDLVKEAILEPVAAWGKVVLENENDSTNEWTSTVLDPTGVWHLLLAACSSDTQQCLQSVFWPLHLRAPNVSATSPNNFVGGANLLGNLLSTLRQSALLGSGVTIDDGSQPWNGEQLDDDYEAKRAQRMIIRQGTWVLLEALLCPNIQGSPVSLQNVTSHTVVDASFVVSCWRSLWAEIESTQNILDCESDGQRILRVLAYLSPSVSAQEASTLAAELLTLLQNFDVTAATANDMLRALMNLCTAKAPTSEAATSMCASCAISILDNAHRALKEFIFPECVPPDLGVIERALFLIGEVSLLSFSPDDNGLAADGRAVLNIEISSEIISLIRVMLGSTLPQPDGFHRPEGNEVPDSVRAFAFVALGKICLVDRSMAKECITLLVREIDESSETSSPAVMSNSLLVLGDLCVRYTSLVERHLPALAQCLQSQHALMRRHALLLLSQLLLQDFLKWRGLMLHRFLLCCIDEDPEVNQLATFLIAGPLTQKQPNLLKHAPLELLFILNNHVDHPIYQKALRQGGDGCNASAVDFSGVGLISLTKRARLLRFVCSAMNDEQRIHMTGLVSQEVLGAPMDFGAVDGVPFKVLRDALVLLSSPEIKVTSSGAGDNVTEEEMVTAAANGHAASVAAHSMESAKRKLLSNFSKKQLMEHVVPIVLDLKAALEQLRSPLLKDLMSYLTDLLKTYRVEAKAVLSVTDPVLAKELEYDLKALELSMRKQRQLYKSAQNDHSTKSGSPSVGFSSPKSKPTSLIEADSLKSMKRPGSSRKPFPTPKLRGAAQTPRSDRQGRTPLAAISSALGKPTTPGLADGPCDRSQVGVDYMISSSGLRNLHVVRPNPPTPLVASVHLEGNPQHVWDVNVKAPSFPNNMPRETENESPCSPTSTAKKMKASDNNDTGNTIVGDSLVSLRQPNHRTPNETKKKKRITS